jgi:hypothetical protein
MATRPPLLTTSGFAVLAGSGITVAGAVNSTNITGDIGTHPTPAITGLGNVVLVGTNHAADAFTAQAKVDLVAAYVNAAGQTPVVTVPTELGGTTKTPGVYDSVAGTFGMTGTLTLDAQGDPNAIFIFKMASTLITAAASNIVLLNGAQACNVFWQVGSSATLGTNSSFLGTILALTSITVTTGATVNGRLLARNGAVTLDTNTVSVCVLASSASPTNVNALLKTSNCFLEPCMFEQDREAIELYVMVENLAVSGGADYRGNLTELQTAAKQFQTLAKNQRRAIALYIDLQNVLAGSPAFGATANSLKTGAKCYECWGHEFRLNLLLYLKVQLNALGKPE